MELPLVGLTSQHWETAAKISRSEAGKISKCDMGDAAAAPFGAFIAH